MFSVLRTGAGNVGRGALISVLLTWISHAVADGRNFYMRVSSSRPDMVSGDDTLVELKIFGDGAAAFNVRLNGQDVSGAFRSVDPTGLHRGLLTGLRQGRNVLELRIAGRVESRIEIVNHPLVGPIFSGPHQQPFICETVANGLGQPLNSDCEAKTVVQYYYKSTEEPEIDSTIARASLTPGFKPYDSAKPPPPDLAQTVTSEGHTVSYIVRREVGTINRAVYEIQFLHRPGTPLPTPWTQSPSGWNGRLVYFFEGGCGAGYHQGTLGAVGAAQEPFIALGYAFATSTLNVFQNTCNDRVSAETLSMVKEYFIKRYGRPIHTIGWGGSGGAMQLYLTAQNFPGLLDGIIPYISFPDVVTYMQTEMDCFLLDRFFSHSELSWTEEQKAAVSGFATWRTCPESAALPVLDPRILCDRVIPKDMLYDRVVHANGVRCDVYDNEINVFGRDPRTGLARHPLDNVGVQYGLAAFRNGAIDGEHFVELNEKVGGFGEDGSVAMSRTEANLVALRIAYRRGVVLTGGGGLNQIPIIDWRPYTDDLADEHVRVRSLVTRARLIAANGSADNQVILVFPRYAIGELTLAVRMQSYEAIFAQRGRDLLRKMDQWLDNIVSDRGTGSVMAKIARSRPEGLSDGCRLINGDEILEHAAYDERGRCNELYPASRDPRLVAGAPGTDDVLKCVLKPVRASDYPKSLTAGELKRLTTAFSSGVCDYDQPGVGQEAIESTWQHFNPDAATADALP